MKALFFAAAIMLLPLAGCTSKPAASTINDQAALTGQLPYNPLAWKVITSSVNQRTATMSTLYGNGIAVQYARTNADRPYPAGSVLALVVWAQREDPHWFGAKIPSTVQSVEFVTIQDPAGASSAYECYQGSPLTRTAATAGDADRIAYLTAQRAAVMP
jgi:hypothetical protein